MIKDDISENKSCFLRFHIQAIHFVASALQKCQNEITAAYTRNPKVSAARRYIQPWKAAHFKKEKKMWRDKIEMKRAISPLSRRQGGTENHVDVTKKWLRKIRLSIMFRSFCIIFIVTLALSWFLSHFHRHFGVTLVFLALYCRYTDFRVIFIVILALSWFSWRYSDFRLIFIVIMALSWFSVPPGNSRSNSSSRQRKRSAHTHLIVWDSCIKVVGLSVESAELLTVSS